MTDLTARRCVPCEGGVPALSPEKAQEFLARIPGWELSADGHWISRRFEFNNYYETMAFVNAIAWVAHREDHHPDLEVGFSACTVRYTTHAARGLTENDFICAAKVNQLLIYGSR